VLFWTIVVHADASGRGSPRTCGVITGSTGALYVFT
jgi:hypothetical protein